MNVDFRSVLCRLHHPGLKMEMDDWPHVSLTCTSWTTLPDLPGPPASAVLLTPLNLLTTFCMDTKASILTSCITVWSGIFWSQDATEYSALYSDSWMHHRHASKPCSGHFPLISLQHCRWLLTTLMPPSISLLPSSSPRLLDSWTVLLRHTHITLGCEFQYHTVP